MQCRRLKFIQTFELTFSVNRAVFEGFRLHGSFPKVSHQVSLDYEPYGVAGRNIVLDAVNSKVIRASYM